MNDTYLNLIGYLVIGLIDALVNTPIDKIKSCAQSTLNKVIADKAESGKSKCHLDSEEPPTPSLLRRRVADTG